MCGALVRMRKCSSASRESGTDRNCVSAAVSASALRKPKIVAAAPGEAGAFPPNGVDKPKKRMAEERSAAKRTLIGSDVKVSKVAQVLAAVRNGILADRFIRFIFAVCTNFTNLTTWCYRVIYYRYEASYYDFSRCSSQGHGRLLAITRGSSLAHDRHAGGFARVPARTRISEGIS